MILSMLILGVFSYTHAQTYSDYIGAGNDSGITVTTSSSEANSDGNNTINGKGLDAAKYEASRFLAQATLGHTMTQIESLATGLDFDAWIDDQIAQTPTNFLDETFIIYDEVVALQEAAGVPEEDIDNPHGVHFNYAWWQSLIDKDDQLRQRVAFALSELLVISMESGLKSWPEAIASFYDIFTENAFGNYSDILTEVAMHPSMGFYLSHYNNPMAVPEENIHPDENFAREIMQLFSIGLFELNQDGSEKLDINGKPIPTYDQDDIKDLAKVFTGLSAGGLEDWVEWTDEPYFGIGIYACDKTIPMVMYDEYHETEEKTILGENFSAGQTGMEDINQAIDLLFNHPNIAPFVSFRLIQRLVKSNPSPEYITRVSNAFDDNGSGVRGDMVAVIKAILLDEEARTCASMLANDAGKLKEPIIRYTQVARGLEKDSPAGRYWNHGFNYSLEVQQIAMNSPTVFNFYLPDHEPAGLLSDNGLVGPEFQIHTTATATGYINYVHKWMLWDKLMWSWEQDYGDIPVTVNDFDYDLMAGEDAETFINYLDILFTHGRMSDETRNTIRNAITPLAEMPDVDSVQTRSRLAIYLTLISSEFAILR